MDQELRAYLEGMEARINERFERMDERFEKVETEARHTRILVEGLDHKIQLVAESVVGVSERLEAFKEETARNFAEVKASFATQHRNLSRRVEILETRAAFHAGDVKPQT